jgi:DNA-binding NarL/FixJ family response regulator
MIRMLLADGNSTLRLGVRAMLVRGSEVIEIDEVESREQLLMNLRAYDYDVVMIDPALVSGAGEGLIKHIRAIAPGSNILVFTSMDEATFGLRMVRSGAKGYLQTNCSAEELATAVMRVASGRMYIGPVLSEEIANQLCKVKPDKPHHSLTERELQVFSMLVFGKTITETADELCLSVKTISTHKIRLMRKLKICNLSEMIQYAISQDILEGSGTRYSSFCMSWMTLPNDGVI